MAIAVINRLSTVGYMTNSVDRYKKPPELAEKKSFTIMMPLLKNPLFGKSITTESLAVVSQYNITCLHKEEKLIRKFKTLQTLIPSPATSRRILGSWLPRIVGGTSIL